MGGIFGVIGEARSEELAAMGDRIAHRGISRYAAEIDADAWLGIVSKANPEHILFDGEIALVADSSIYNADELFDRIDLNGDRPSTENKGALLLAAYRRFGTDVFSMLNGDFAIAIWDLRDRALILARDPLGFRPLFYSRTPKTQRTVFSSEYKSLLVLDDLPAEPDLEIIQHLQYAKFPPPDRTLLAGVYSVPPGHWIKFTNGSLVRERFWYPSVRVRDRGEGDSAQFIRSHLIEAVERRVGDLSVVGIALSGGIDSAGLAATIRYVYPDIPIHTFTAGDDLRDPEMTGAEAVARHLGTSHHSVVVEPELIPQLMPSLVWHLEDPVARNEVIFLCEAVKSATGLVDVMLTGCGPDTLFGGMSKYKLVQLSQVFPPFRKPLDEFFNYSQVGVQPRTVGGRLLTTMYYRGDEAAVPRVRGTRYTPDTTQLPTREPEAINNFLANGLLAGYRSVPKFERLYAARGLELRSPFFDLELVSAAYQVPSRYKMRRWREKHVFREALRPWLPDDVLNRPKHPTRMTSNLRFSQVMEQYARSVLTPTALRSRGLFDPAEVEKLLRRPSGGAFGFGHAMRVWTLVMTELWAQTFLDRRGAAFLTEADSQPVELIEPPSTLHDPRLGMSPFPGLWSG